MRHTSSYLVGIGASAGGLSAIKTLVTQIQAVSVPITYVICQHLAPDKRSYMKDILADIVSLPLKVIESGNVIEGDTIYLSPPGRQVAVIKGHFVLTDLPQDHTPARSIDFFFKSLALEFKSRCFGVILSGSGNDGLKGCQEIYEAGGEIFVQEPIEAEFPSMPESVINSGFYTKSLEAKDIFEEVKSSLRDNTRDQFGNRLFEDVHSNIDSIAKVINDEFGINIRDYKFATICRRIAKRLQNLKHDSAKGYSDLLISDPNERSIFLSEILISVTSFFRDSEFYDSLKAMLEEVSLEVGAEYRIWSAGCSHGEEAYSLLMVVCDSFEKRGIKNPIKLFATDVNGQNLDIATRGFYTEAAFENVPIEFRRKFFDKVSAGYTIKRFYREMIIFSRHDLLQSPPFSGIDLAVCRNLLIYLNPSAQNKSLLNLVFSIHINGALALGPSESLGFLQQYFEPISKKWRIFKKLRNAGGTLSSHWRAPRLNGVGSNNIANLKAEKLFAKSNPIHECFASLYPHSLLIDDQFELCAVFGQGHQLLRSRSDGVVNQLIESMIKDSALLSLRAGMSEAKNSNKSIVIDNIVLDKEGLTPLVTSLTVSWLIGAEVKGFYLCVVGDNKSLPQEKIARDALSKDDVAHTLKIELDQAKIALQEAVTELELTNEELQTSNEELIASNEELQSTNEELSSVNEELYTLNGELQQKIDQISIMNDDLNNLINSTQVGVIFLDKKSFIRRMTPIVEQSFFIRHSDVGRSIFELDFGIYLDTVREQLSAEKVVVAKFEIQAKSNESFLCSVLPYYNDLAQHQGHVISLVNITESIVREHLLNETQSEAKIGGFIFDLCSESTTWTRQVYDIFDIPLNTPIGRGFGIEYYSAKESALLEQSIEACRVGGQAFESTHSLITPTGKLKWVRIAGRAIKDRSGQILQIRGTIQDVTEHRFLNERMDLALGVAKVGIWDWNIQSDALYWNKEQIELYGLTKATDQITYSDWQSSVHPEDLARAEAGLQDAVKSGGLFNEKFRIIKNQEIRYVHASAKVFQDYSGRPVRMIGVNFDITDSTLADLHLAEERQLSFHNSKLASIGELAAGVGHEINNPLAIMMGHNKSLRKVLETRTQLTPELKIILDQQDDAGRRIRDIVNGLRTFARTDAVVQPYSVCELTENLLSLVKEIYEKAGITLYFQRPLSDYWINVNYGQIQQVLMNLLSNAKDAVALQNAKRIELEISRNANQEVEVSVTDTGAGIKPADLRRIFETFYTTKPVGQGTGLGLSLSKKIIEDNHGRVEVQSEYGVGSCFKVILPEFIAASVDQTLQHGISTSNDHPKLHDFEGSRVLLVEDEEILRQIVKEYLEELGCRVVDLGSAIEALELLRTEPFDFVVTDMQMPKMNGAEFITAIRDVLHLKIPCILASGDPSENLINSLKRHNSQLFNGILRKPFDMNDVKLALSEAKESSRVH